MTTQRRVQTYERGSLRVTYDPNLCTHSAVCVRGLPAVFRPQERRWIQLEHAEEEDVAAVVARCPSGALHAERVFDEVAPERGLDSTEVVITLSERGPLLIAGPVTLKTPDGGVIARQTKAALCRCGHTANAPFCDGSHTRVGFSPAR